MKFLKKYKALITIVIIFVLAGGFLLVKGEKRSFENETATNEQSQSSENKEPGEVPDSFEEKKSSDSGKTQPAATSLADLNDVSLTAYLYKEELPGTPAGSIIPYFYISAGTYTIQMKDGGAWKDVVTSKNYPGHGGLSAPAIPANIASATYQVVRIENGKAVAVSKTITVNRTDLSGGVYTYN